MRIRETSNARASNIIMLMFSIIILIISMIYCIKVESSMMYLVVIYATFNVLCSLLPVNVQIALPSIIIRATGFIRYVIIPVSLQINKSEPSLSSFTSIVFVTCLELIAVWYGMYSYSKSSSSYKKKVELDNSELLFFSNQTVGIASIAVIVLGSVLVALNRNILLQYFSVFGNKKSVVIASGYLSLVISVFFILLLIRALYTLKRMSFIRTSLKFVLSIIICLFFVNGTSITAENVSRWSMLFSILICYYYLSKLYPTYQNKLKVLVPIVAIVAVLVGTVMKFSGTNYSEYASVNSTISNLFSYKTLGPYFSGVENAEAAMEMNKEIGIDILRKIIMFISDVFANFPFLNKYLCNWEMRSSVTFNRYFYGGDFAVDQIIPFSYQLYFYFGILFVIVESKLVKICFKLYSAIKNERSFLMIYCLVYLFGSISLLNCISASVMLQNLWIHVMPVFIVYFLDKKIRSR